MNDSGADGGSLLAGYPGRILVGLSGGWVMVMAGQLLLPPLLPTIIEEFEISVAMAGIMLSLLQVANALVLYPSGRFSDQWGRATLIVPGALLVVAGLVLLGTAPTFWVLVLGVVCFGVGRGLYNTPVRALLSDLFVERRGRALGIFATSFDIGGLAASGIAIVVVASGNWRSPFLGLAGLMFVIAAAYAYGSREPFVVERTELEVVSTIRRLIATPQQRETIVAFSLFFFVAASMLNFLPAYLQATKGFSPALATSGFAVYFLVGIASKPTAGWLGDRFHREAVAAGALVLALLALGALVVLSIPSAIAIAIAAYAVGHKALFPLVDAILLDAAPDANVGGDLGAARTVFFGIGALGPAYVGITADTFGYTVAFAGLVGCLLVSVLVLGGRWFVRH